MFCPFCGSEDKQSSQFCRKCGADLRPTLNAIRNSDSQQSSGRDELYRAVADKIREAPSAGELAAIADRVIPKLERLMEPPEKARERQILAGITALFGGLGFIAFYVVHQHFYRYTEPGLQNILLAAAFIGLMVGLGHLLYAVFSSHSNLLESGATQRLDAEALKKLVQDKQALPLSEGPQFSVTESTTQELEVSGRRQKGSQTNPT
ncbi:MAG TPA: zinc ribbon domain-containing protein [Blastocatellia bacterium]|nr:zinc ribbon domain-containing protein [Blastocatellia bacterium]